MCKNVFWSLHCLCRLAGCGLTNTSCKTVASVLRLQHSHLRELDLSNNSLNNAGLEELTTALLHSNYKLEKLGYETHFGCSCYWFPISTATFTFKH